MLVELAGAGPRGPRRPSRTTSTRSARPSTSSTSLETTTTATPASARAADECVDLRAGADVDAAGRLVQQQHPAVAQQPAGQHDLLLVAARQRAPGRSTPAGRTSSESAISRRPCARRALVEEAERGRSASSDEAVMLANTDSSSRGPGSCAPRGTARCPARHPRRHRPVRQPATPPGPSRRGAARAVQRLDDLRAPGADEPGQPDDLARLHGEVDTGRRRP